MSAVTDDSMWERSRVRYPEINELDREPEAGLAGSGSVNHPAHYAKHGVECIDVMESVFGRSALLDFCTLNAFKYVWRADSKGRRREDLEKARWYLDKAVSLLDGDKVSEK